ncbi:MAG: trypsin-like peptidase domain-containing protein [Clostridia bacterium]|nr:trypsin-like peptidase domain-containing protein [Clostridia bacterium]
MNEFEKDFFTENKDNSYFEQEKSFNTNDREDDVKACEPSYIWTSDDFQKNTSACTSIEVVKAKKKKSPKFKRYVAIAAAIGIVNLAVLGGIFAVGYGFGSGKLGADSKANVIANLNNIEGETAGIKQTVNTGSELTTVEISKQVGPAVVGITSTVNNVMSIFNISTASEGTGSGIILSSDGYIVTNNHVIDGASAVKVTLNTGSEYEAKVIGSDSKTDLAVIKIKPDETLAVAQLGDSSQIQVGERAIAIGNPLGMEFFGSTTQGIISAINRKITVGDRTMSVIQTDAAINEGNSGGALVNAYGKVIGINAVKIASSSVEGMGFAIPISEAKPIIEDLINYGYVKGRPVLGISARDVTRDMSQRQGWPIGVQVMATQVGSGAEIAGLEQGDIITKADGKEIKNFDDLNEIKDSHKPGEIMQLEVYKYETGLNAKVSVKLTEERPE